MLRSFLLISLIFAAFPLQARLYTWTDPDTGTRQMSGQPPAWYRASDQGPQVAVYENGRLVDDTARETSIGERQRLRKQALIDLKQRQEEAARIEEKQEKIREEEEAAAMRTEPVLSEEVRRIMVQLREQEYIQQMKNIISEWDARNEAGGEQAPLQEQLPGLSSARAEAP